jgi:hypothetical protein
LCHIRRQLDENWCDQHFYNSTVPTTWQAPSSDNCLSHIPVAGTRHKTNRSDLVHRFINWTECWSLTTKHDVTCQDSGSLRIITPCYLVGGYGRFADTRCLYRQGRVRVGTQQMGLLSAETRACISGPYFGQCLRAMNNSQPFYCITFPVRHVWSVSWQLRFFTARCHRPRPSIPLLHRTQIHGRSAAHEGEGELVNGKHGRKNEIFVRRTGKINPLQPSGYCTYRQV